MEIEDKQRVLLLLINHKDKKIQSLKNKIEALEKENNELLTEIKNREDESNQEIG